MEQRLVTIKDFEVQAAKNLPKAAYDYYRSGANASITLQDNIDAFKSIHLKPSLFQDTSAPISTAWHIMSHPVSTPVCIASTAFHRMASGEGELATARAANAYHKTPLKLSSWSNTALEEVAAAAPESLKFFQIYLSKIPQVN